MLQGDEDESQSLVENEDIKELSAKGVEKALSKDGDESIDSKADEEEQPEEENSTDETNVQEGKK